MMEMKLRKVLPVDVNLLFEFANDDSVRSNAINKEKITWENHVEWFNKKLTSQYTHIFILEKDTKPIGQIRFDNVDNHFEIDYSIDSEYRGKGYGSIILKKGIKKINGKIIAKVKVTNKASARVFEKMGFILIKEEVFQEEKYLIFELNNSYKKNDL